MRYLFCTGFYVGIRSDAPQNSALFQAFKGVSTLRLVTKKIMNDFIVVITVTTGCSEKPVRVRVFAEHVEGKNWKTVLLLFSKVEPLS